jgi:hypothetical protein
VSSSSRHSLGLEPMCVLAARTDKTMQPCMQLGIRAAQRDYCVFYCLSQCGYSNFIVFRVGACTCSGMHGTRHIQMWRVCRSRFQKAPIQQSSILNSIRTFKIYLLAETRNTIKSRGQWSGFYTDCCFCTGRMRVIFVPHTTHWPCSAGLLFFSVV